MKATLAAARRDSAHTRVPTEAMSDSAGTEDRGRAGAVDVVVPVFNAAADVARCIDSVLAHTAAPYRLVLIDDASTEPEIQGVLDALAARALPHVLLLRNPENLGFVGTANRGMQLSRADVVLLNSDTVVTDGWLDAMNRCAASNPSFGTITPFSNNAEICSFPRFCENNPPPDPGDAEATRRALVSAAAPTYPDLPTGVGFCMYIRRTLIDAIGVFDPAYGRGYGEENDFCLRGFAVGYRNVLCDDAYVLHLGGRSFVGQKSELGPRNLALLLARHPHYVSMVQDYIAQDPVRPIREAALTRRRADTDARRGVLHVAHHHGGGTERHVRALIGASRDAYRHYLLVAVEDRWQVEEHLDEGGKRTFEIAREADESWSTFFDGICASFRIGLVHVHNISACREGLLDALAAAMLPYGFTVHDVFVGCPTTTFLRDGLFCGGETDLAACVACLARQPAYAGVDIAAWRERHAQMLARAAFVIAPSRWAAQMLLRYFPGTRVEIVPHGLPDRTRAGAMPAPLASGRARVAVLLPTDDVPVVAVIGAIGPDKGARRLERLVEEARRRHAPIRFVLIGYLDREQGPWQSDDARFIIHGRYEPEDLPDLFAHYRVALVVFPSAGPESFSFTLSETWAAGRPVLVPPIGALAERVTESGGGWMWSDEEWANEDRMLDAILERIASTNRDALAAFAERARRAPQFPLAEMARRTAAVYESVPSPHAGVGARPLAPIRMRDALGYRLWYPPIPSKPPGGVTGSGDAAAALPVPVERGARSRRLLGRAWRRLRNLAPSPLREALRARFK